jgi:hypothetical protein
MEGVGGLRVAAPTQQSKRVDVSGKERRPDGINLDQASSLRSIGS